MRAQPTTKQLIEMLYERIPELFDRPQRTWVGLTKEERRAAWDSCPTHSPTELALAIEAKLKELNT